MKFFHTFVLVAMLGLTSCGPQYETRYSFIPPKSPSERICANQCVAEKNQCVRQCNQQLGLLDSVSDITSSIMDSGNNARRSPSDRVARCTSQCEQSHRICHENCGGTVIANKVCVAFCDKALQ